MDTGSLMDAKTKVTQTMATPKKMRQEFADTMLEVGQRDQNLVVLIGDISHFILQPFAKACPGRFYNIGICEPTIMNMAAGLSKVGFFPVVHTITPFLVERSFEQIKLDFGYQRLGINIITVGSAFDYGALGCTHHCYGDFALLKTVENMEIMYPASCTELNALFKQTYNDGHPSYFRIPEEQHNVLFSPEQITFGKGIKVKEGKDLTIVVVGPQLKNVMDAVALLEDQGISGEVIYLHTIKPFDQDLVNESLRKTKRCLVVEEHGMYGGVYDDVLRFSVHLPEIQYNSINIGDKFIHEYGTYEQHCKRLGLSVEGIMKKTEEMFSTRPRSQKHVLKSEPPHQQPMVGQEMIVGQEIILGQEINLLSKYPQPKRLLEQRAQQRTKEDIEIAKKFGKEYFDGMRNQGYGGYHYHPRFWTDVVQDFIVYYGLTKKSKILDVGCGKGFMLYDFLKAIPGISLRGIDISPYAIENSLPEVKPLLSVGNAKDLSRFKDKEFDVVISINTIHNLKIDECQQALREIERVGKHAFITNDAWRNEQEKERMLQWNLTGETVMHTDDWKKLFKEVGYTGDYYWFIP